jgi:hypothetical protein
MNPLITRLIKIVSPIAIIGAIILEIELVYLYLNQVKIANFLTIIMIIASFALVIHFMEGIIASFLATRKGLNPWKYGIYTFLVGTVGLFELWKQK